MPSGNKSNHRKNRQGVFISYARSDGKVFANHLRQQLGDEGFKLWQDLTEMTSGDWWLQITEALDNVEFMALVITPNALKSDIVRKEWRHARQQGVCVYPIKGAPDLDFKSMPRWMRDQHFYDLSEKLGWEKFIADLKRSCSTPRVPFMVDDLPEDFVERPASSINYSRCCSTISAKSRWRLLPHCAARAVTAKRRWRRRSATTSRFKTPSMMASSG